MSDEEGKSPLASLTKAMGGGMTKERRSLMYFGQPPKGAYFGKGKRDLAHIHDLSMSEETKKRLYGIGGGYGRIPLTFEPSEVPEPSGDALQQINESEMQEDTHSSPTRRLSPIQKLSLGVRE